MKSKHIAPNLRPNARVKFDLESSDFVNHKRGGVESVSYDIRIYKMKGLSQFTP